MNRKRKPNPTSIMSSMTADPLSGHSKPKNAADADMSLSDHLRELRRRLVTVIILFSVAVVVSFFFIQNIAEGMMKVGLEAGFTFVYLSPSELLTAYFQLAAVFGLFVSLPVILYELWRFASPALNASEKKAGRAGLAAGFVFFLLGMVFCYLIALPFMIRFLSNFNTSAYIASNISVAEFLNFALGMLVTFGLVFELPILTLILTRLRLLRPGWMVKTRKYAVLVIFIIAAIITPPDVLSQVMIALPMIGLYELSILLSRMIWKRMDREDEQPGAAQ